MIQQCMTTSFKQQILLGQQNLGSDTLYMALYTAFSTIGPSTTNYTIDNEVVGTGYTAGGQVLTNVSVSTNDGVAYVNFNNVIWNPAVFTARGALIYNASQGNASIAVIDFGADKTSTNVFTVTMPANTASTALIRIT